MEGEGVAIRYPAIAELEVDSRDRYPTGAFILDPAQIKTSSDILFPARQSLLTGYFTRLGLSQVNLQWNTPNINDYNNEFRFTARYFDQSAVSTITSTYIVSLDTGFHDQEELATNMAELMGFNMFDPPLTGFSTIFVPDNAQSEPNFNTDDWFVKVNDSSPLVSTFASTFMSSLNFRFERPLSNAPPQERKFWITAERNWFTFAPGFTRFEYAFSGNASLAYTEYIDIISDNLSKYSKVKDSMTRQFQGQTNVLARVFLVPYSSRQEKANYYSKPFYLAIDYTTMKNMRWSPGEYLNDFDLKLIDQYGELLYWDPDYGTEYQLNLQVSET